ncbi:MAG: hypothetical protein KA173_05795 [Rhodoferax sp.]|nr:hypothetical protein [Rhodoferax sp.]MBP7492858.1 hypothetical protein [Rhodoferax sp.]
MQPTTPKTDRLLGIVVAVAFGKMGFEKVASAHWFDVATPFAFGRPIPSPKG